MSHPVVVLRLSGTSADEAMALADALVNDRSVPDLSHLLVVDDTTALAAHSEVFAHLLVPGRVPHLMCLSVGAPPRPGRLMLPAGIAADRSSVVLWVADPLGIDWPLRASAVATLRPESGPHGDECLIDLLTSVDFFDRVRRLVATMPNAVASPGIRLAEPGVMSAASFLAALADAIPRLVGSAGDNGRPSAEPYLELARKLPGRPLRLDGELLRAMQCCAAAVSAANTSIDDLAHLTSLPVLSRAVGEARAKVTAAGTALRDLRSLSERTVGVMPAHDALTVPDPGKAAEPQATAMTEVIKLIAASLRGGESACTAIDRLTATERSLHLGPPPSQDKLDQCCPSSLTDQLTNPPPLPPPGPWLPLAGALTTALAGQGGIIGVIVAVLGWIGVTALLTGPARLRAGARATYLIINSAAAAAGGLFSLALTIAGRPPLVSAAGAVVALATAVAATGKSWRTQVRTWRRVAGLNKAESAGADLVQLVAAALSQLDAASTDVVEELARVRIVMGGISDRLGELAEDQRQATECRPGILKPSQLNAILLAFLIDLVLAVLGDLPASGAGQGQADYDWAQTATDKLVAIWSDHVEHHGPLTPPPFATVDGEQPATSQAWNEVIAATLATDPADAMWQLCMPRDLSMLDVDSSPQVLPFAPRATRSALARSAPADTEWTPSGCRAGLLRLIPIKVAAVDTTPLPEHDRDPSS